MNNENIELQKRLWAASCLAPCLLTTVLYTGCQDSASKGQKETLTGNLPVRPQVSITGISCSGPTLAATGSPGIYIGGMTFVLLNHGPNELICQLSGNAVFNSNNYPAWTYSNVLGVNTSLTGFGVAMAPTNWASSGIEAAWYCYDPTSGFATSGSQLHNTCP